MATDEYKCRDQNGNEVEGVADEAACILLPNHDWLHEQSTCGQINYYVQVHPELCTVPQADAIRQTCCTSDVEPLDPDDGVETGGD